MAASDCACHCAKRLPFPIVPADDPALVDGDDVDGLLVPVRNADALANAIARLDRDPRLRARLGAAARKHALAEFDEQIVIQKTLSVYQELL